MAHVYLKRPFFLPSFSAGKFHIFKKPVTKKKIFKLFQNCEMIFFYGWLLDLIAPHRSVLFLWINVVFQMELSPSCLVCTWNIRDIHRSVCKKINRYTINQQMQWILSLTFSSDNDRMSIFLKKEEKKKEMGKLI